MEWLIVAALGAVVGTLFSLFARSIHMPQSLCLLLGAIGGLAGAALYRITGVTLFGAWTFYIAGALMAVGLLAGGTFAYSLTSSDERV